VIFPGRGLVLPVAAALSVSLSLVSATPARAQWGAGHGDAAVDAGAPSRERARAQDLLGQGNDLFRAGRFAEALRAYREAHDLFPSAKLFFNIGRCEESLGHRTQAIVNLRAFVKQSPDADPDVRADAEHRIAELARALGAIDVSALPANAALTVDGQGVGLTPLGDSLWLEPGTHRVTLDRAGKPLWFATVEAQPGTTIPLTISESTNQAPAPPSGGPEGGAPPPAATPTATRGRWWIWAGLGLLVAGATTTVLVLKLRCQQTQCE
jgi:tetratricopeptide (TPR) repeat protein